MTDAQTNSAQSTEQGTATPEQTLQAQTSQQGQPAENTQETHQPQFVTKEDLAQFGNQIVKQLKQSARDRDNRIEQEVKALKDRLTPLNVPLSPQQESALRTQIAEQLEAEDAQPEQQAPQPGNADDLVNQFINESLAVFGEGVKANPNSPYFADLQKALTANFNNPSPAAVNKAIFEYGRKEAERIANQSANADARVIGNGGRTEPAQTDAPASSLWKQAYSK